MTKHPIVPFHVLHFPSGDFFRKYAIFYTLQVIESEAKTLEETIIGGAISTSTGFRDIYDNSQMSSLEFNVLLCSVSFSLSMQMLFYNKS